jgi:hypothetical protein
VEEYEKKPYSAYNKNFTPMADEEIIFVEELA